MEKKHLIGISFIVILSILVVQNPLSSQYVSSLKQSSSVAVIKQEDPLLKKITEEAEVREKAPQDAKIDPVWKALPGYNGIKVDIEESYKKMKQEGEFKENLLVYEQIPPKVHLIDLPPSPIYKGHPEKPMASFIINVAWGNEYIPDMLETLKKHHVYATFFLEGRWVKHNPELAKMIVDAGHEVGNHSYSHPDMKTLAAEKAREEIKQTNEMIEATTGKRVKWFAPPSGSYRDEIVTIADEYNLKTVMWSVDTIDWQKPDPSVIVNRVTKKLHNGAIILMHPTDSTAKSLEQLITAIKAKNIRLGTITNLMKEERILQQGNNSSQEGKLNSNN